MNLTPNNKSIENEIPQDENLASSSIDASEPDEDIVLAELVNDSPNQSEIVVAELASAAMDNIIPAPIPTGFKTEEMTARGAVVASIVLGILCVSGSLFSSYSTINGFLGISMWYLGFLKSNGKNTSYLGLGLCLVGLSLSISSWLGLISSIIFCLLLIVRFLSNQRRLHASR